MYKTTHDTIRTVDQNELRTDQFLTVTILLTAFVLNRWELIAFQTVFFILALIHPALNPYHALYRFILNPVGLIKSDIRKDNTEPGRFADFIGLIFSSAATYFVVSGNEIIGWGMIWAMIILGSAAFTGWCAGSFMYYMINRLGLKGFFKNSPVGGVFPGLRPPK